LQKIDDLIRLDVKDNGLGIDLERQGRKIFGMYKTFHKHPDARGIGLFLTKNQVGALGGRIDVDSKVDEGTVFSVYLRAVKENQE
jgi:sensor histidine kinase regulating citrate/malate metabolism